MVNFFIALVNKTKLLCYNVLVNYNKRVTMIRTLLFIIVTGIVACQLSKINSRLANIEKAVNVERFK